MSTLEIKQLTHAECLHWSSAVWPAAGGHRTSSQLEAKRRHMKKDMDVGRENSTEIDSTRRHLCSLRLFYTRPSILITLLYVAPAL